jgi:UDP-N-acetylmuramyl pentapeptide phosphotransferase/UDP-N-acetylglucosamine-1-phosphate transferase
LVAALLAVPLVLGAEAGGRAANLVDRPRRGELQEKVLPRTGGYGVFLAFWTAIALSFLIAPDDLERLPADNWRLVGLFLGSVAILPLAYIDDRRRLGPLPQFVGHVVIATIPVLFGLEMREIASPFGVVTLPDWAAGPLAVIWIVGMINAINFLDTMDGLSGGIGGIAALVLFLRTAWFGQASIAVLPLALAGSCLGYLTRNWHPSRVIFGSSGALLLGYLLGAISVIGGAKIGTAFLVLAVPILDVAWVIYRRISQGRTPFRGGDDEHLPHRLRLLGLSTPAIVLTLYAVTSAVGIAVLMNHSTLPTLSKLYLAGGVVVLIFAGLAIVARLTSSRTAAHREM